MTREEFAELIRLKYKQYVKIPSEKLVAAVFAKFPAYQERPELSSIAATPAPTPTPTPRPTPIPQTPEEYRDLIQQTADQYNIPANLLSAKIMQESTFRPDVTSPVGAMGISQIMPATAKEISRLHGEFDPMNPQQAIPAGAFYLDHVRKAIGREGTEVEDWVEALKAYNAGIGNYRKFKGDIPFKETREYIPKILDYAEITL